MGTANRIRWVLGLGLILLALQAAPARAQWGPAPAQLNWGDYDTGHIWHDAAWWWANHAD